MKETKNEGLAIIKDEAVALKLFNGTALKATIAQYKSICDELEVVDPSSEKIAEDMLGDLNKVIKKLEETKKVIKKPYLDANKLIESVYKDILGESQATIVSGKSKIAKYRESVRIKEENDRDEKIAKAENKLNQSELDSIELERQANSLFIAEHTAIQEIRIINDINALKEWHTKYSAPSTSIINASLAPDFQEKISDVLDRMQLIKEAKKESLLNSSKESTSNFESTLKLVTSQWEESNLKLSKMLKSNLEVVSSEAQLIIQAAEIEAAEKKDGVFLWQYEVVDFDQIPDGWKILNPDVVKEYIAKNKFELVEGSIVNGIVFKRKEVIRLI